jgi:hypothetical protein
LLSHRFPHSKVCGETMRCSGESLKNSIKSLSGEEVELQEAEYLLDGTAQFGFAFQVSQHEINAEGYPNLG